MAVLKNGSRERKPGSTRFVASIPVVKRIDKFYFAEIAHSPLRGEIMRVKAVAFALALMTPAVSVAVNWHTAHVRETLQPQKKWTLFLVPHVQLDVGYSPLSP
jgi:hypothetical protein